MTAAFDERIVRVSLDINGEDLVLEGLDIRARGRKLLTYVMDQCDIQITNLTKEQRNYIITNSSPLLVKGRGNGPNGGRNRMKVRLDVGRQSYGTFRLFEGDAFACLASQPPDIAIRLSALANNFSSGIVDAQSQSGVRDLKVICQQVADSFDPPLNLEFKATPRNIDNWAYTASPTQAIYKLNQIGNIMATASDGILLVIDANAYRDDSVRVINMATGMVGIPNVDDNGVTVQMLVDNSIRLGNRVKIESQINPAANGEFRVAQINFDITNRHDPFWYTLVCNNLNFSQGTI